MRAFCCAVSLTNSFGFCLSFFLGTLKKGSLKMNCFSMVSTRGHSNLISNSYHFLMGKYTIVLICFSQHTFPNVSRFFFFFFFYLQVSSVEIGLGLYLNIYSAEFHFG